MPKSLVPHMGPHGWSSDDDTNLDVLLAHFYVSQGRQSQVFSDTIASMTAIMQDKSANPQGATQKLETVLTTYLGRYFDAVSVKVTIKNEEAAAAELLVKIGYTSNGKQKSALRALQPSGGVFHHVIRTLNG